MFMQRHFPLTKGSIAEIRAEYASSGGAMLQAGIVRQSARNKTPKMMLILIKATRLPHNQRRFWSNRRLPTS
jgi:hypothetical protein